MSSTADLTKHFLEAVDNAAIASAAWRGKGDKNAADDAAVEAMRRVPDADLVVMGEVPRMLQAWAKSTYPRVRFLGRVDDPERVIGSAHALVLPTMYDPSSNAVLEAMSCGVPAVTTLHDGAAELLPHRWMAISDPLDAARCAEVLVAVMNEATLGETCRTIASQYTMDKGFTELLNVIAPGETK